METLGHLAAAVFSQCNKCPCVSLPAVLLVLALVGNVPSCFVSYMECAALPSALTSCDLIHIFALQTLPFQNISHFYSGSSSEQEVTAFYTGSQTCIINNNNNNNKLLKD